MRTVEADASTFLPKRFDVDRVLSAGKTELAADKPAALIGMNGCRRQRLAPVGRRGCYGSQAAASAGKWPVCDGRTQNSLPNGSFVTHHYSTNC